MNIGLDETGYCTIKEVSLRSYLTTRTPIEAKNEDTDSGQKTSHTHVVTSLDFHFGNIFKFISK